MLAKDLMRFTEEQHRLGGLDWTLTVDLMTEIDLELKWLHSRGKDSDQQKHQSIRGYLEQLAIWQAEIDGLASGS